MGAGVSRLRPRALVALACAFVLTLVPLATPPGVQDAWGVSCAQAEEERVIEKVNVASEAELVEAMLAWKSDEATIVLTSNITLRSPLRVRDGMDVKIDLKGRTLSRDLEDFVKDGHVILVEEFATLNIVDTSAKGSGRISGGRAQDGGGIYNLGTLNLTGGTIVDCKAKECGGGIHNSGTMTITSTWIEKCEAKGGGGIYNRGIAAVGAKNVQDNVATETGGGILNDAKMTLTRCTVRRNTARYAGGIANRIVSYTDESTLELSGCTVTANTGTSVAGGIMGTRDIWDPSTEAKGTKHKGLITIGGASKVTNNSSETVGGVLCEYGCSLSLTGATVTGNTSSLGGQFRGTPVAGGVSFNGKANMAHKDPSATFSLQGKNTIKNNKCSGVASDTMMGDYDAIVVSEKLTGSSIGVTPTVGPIWEFTQDYDVYNEEAPSKFFFTPAARSVKLRHGEVGLVEPVPYVNEDGTDVVTDEYDLAESVTGSEWYAGTYVAYRNAKLEERVTLHGDVRLVLRDDVTVEFQKGIELPNDGGKWTTLDILAQKGQSGSLTAEGGTGQAGIGSRGSTYSRLIMHAGNVLAIGGKGGAGIGGGDMRPGENRMEVEIVGGTLIARGGARGAGIGCGTAGNLRGLVTIRGGDVTAIGDGGGAGIGGGAYSSTYMDVEFLGGMTLAQSNYEGADAAGYGVGDEGFAEVTVGEGMSVLSGGNVDWYKRVATCKDATSVVVNPCTHKAEHYEYVDDKTHEAWCRYCGANRHVEAHRLASDRTCACGYETPTYTIYYDPAGGRGFFYIGESAYEGETLTLADCSMWQPDGLPPSGKYFLAWDVDGELRQPGEAITMTKNVTAKAVWDDICRVRFQPGEGTGSMKSVLSAKGAKLTLPECTLQGPDGKGFAGWKLGDRTYAAGDTLEVTGNLDFVAQWGMNWKMLQAAIDAASDGETIVLGNDVRAADDDAALRVAAGKRVTIDLAGHAIDRHLTKPKKDGYCIYVAGSLDVIDTSEGATGRITGANNANRRRGRTHDLVGGGIVVDEGSLTLSGGSITGNEAGDGAGVQLVCSGSSFRMSGGSVSDNVGHGAGGGVYVAYGSTFEMTGGAICGNAIPASEDVSAGEEGAGIYMSGDISLAGDPTIADNTSADGRASNVYMFYANARIRITAPFAPATPVGVATRRPSPVAYITAGLTSRGKISDFVADDPEQVVGPDGDEAVMRRPSALVFDAGGEEVDGEMEPAEAAYGQTVSLPEPGFTSRAHRAFRAWSIAGRTYEVGRDYIVHGRETATALWDDTYEVTFDAAGGTGTCEPAYVVCGGRYALPGECPFEAPDACEFAGWKVGERSYAPGEEIVVDAPLTVSAAWDMTWSGLQRLIEAKEEVEVTLPHDLVAGTDDGPLTIAQDKLVTIDLAGHTIDRAAPEALGTQGDALGAQAESSHAGAVFWLPNGYSDLTIRDSVGGGTITGARGSAVFVGGGPMVLVELTDVNVTGNEVTYGICDIDGELALTGSHVTGNHGTYVGGVYVGTCGLRVGAGSTIIDNTCEGRLVDVLLDYGATIEVEGVLSPSSIGVATRAQPHRGTPVRLTSGLFGYGDEGSFRGQREPYLVTIGEDDEAYLVVPVTVSVVANGGKGSMVIDPLPEGLSYPLPACTLRPPAGKSFDAWSVRRGSGGAWFEAEPDERVTLTLDMTLMALWADHEHVLVEVPAREPTCTEDGWQAHWACSVTDRPCGRVFADGEGKVELEPGDVVRPATGHVPAPAVVENRVEATADTRGSYDSVTYCSVCGVELDRDHIVDGILDPTDPTIPTEHACVPGEPVEETVSEPTCEEGGVVQVVTYCSVCGKEMDREMRLTEALGHDWGEPTYEWADDLTTVTARRVCSRDRSHIETETAKVVSHTTTIEGSSQLLITYTAEFENAAFASASREALVQGEDGGKDDGKDDGKEGSEGSGEGRGPSEDDGGSKPSSPSQQTRPTTPSTTLTPTTIPVPFGSLPLGTQGTLFDGYVRPLVPWMGSGGVASDRASDSTGTGQGSSQGSSQSQSGPSTTTTTSGATTAATPGAPATGTIAGGVGAPQAATPGDAAATGAGATPNAGAPAQAPVSAPAPVQRQVSPTQVTGAGEDEAGAARGEAPVAPLATTADASASPGPLAVAGALVALIALWGRRRARGGEPR